MYHTVSSSSHYIVRRFEANAVLKGELIRMPPLPVSWCVFVLFPDSGTATMPVAKPSTKPKAAATKLSPSDDMDGLFDAEESGDEVPLRKNKKRTAPQTISHEQVCQLLPSPHCTSIIWVCEGGWALSVPFPVQCWTPLPPPSLHLYVSCQHSSAHGVR